MNTQFSNKYQNMNTCCSVLWLVLHPPRHTQGRQKHRQIKTRSELNTALLNCSLCSGHWFWQGGDTDLLDFVCLINLFSYSYLLIQQSCPSFSNLLIQQSCPFSFFRFTNSSIMSMFANRNTPMQQYHHHHHHHQNQPLRSYGNTRDRRNQPITTTQLLYSSFFVKDERG